MLDALIVRNPDLKRLQDEGYSISTCEGYAVIEDIPYLDGNLGLQYGALASPLQLAGEQTVRPTDHRIWFSGEMPCDDHQRQITAIAHATCDETIGSHTYKFIFSNKPGNGYADYYEKFLRYITIISAPAKALHPDVTPCKYKPIETSMESVFCYADTCSSRAGLIEANDCFRSQRIGVIGLGGTGAYVLDLVAKTPVMEIHIFDGDKFYQHNAFRAPGATSLIELQQQPTKVDYYASEYAKMRKDIHAHPEYIDDRNIDQLDSLDFVFICIDSGIAKYTIVNYLRSRRIPFVDTGISAELVEKSVLGMVRCTCYLPEKRTKLEKYISMEPSGRDDAYSSDIQIADMNALNAALAVMRWKKYCGFYLDREPWVQTVFSTTTGGVANAKT